MLSGRSALRGGAVLRPGGAGPVPALARGRRWDEVCSPMTRGVALLISRAIRRRYATSCPWPSALGLLATDHLLADVTVWDGPRLSDVLALLQRLSDQQSGLCRGV